MNTITPNTPDDALDDCGKQIKFSVTTNYDDMDTWLEIIASVDMEDLSPAAVKYCLEQGIEDAVDYSMGEYLDGYFLDYRVLRDSRNEIVNIQLLTAFGGPNIWETIYADGRFEVDVHWWMSRGYGGGQHDLKSMMFDYMEDCICIVKGEL